MFANYNELAVAITYLVDQLNLAQIYVQGGDINKVNHTLDIIQGQFYELGFLEGIDPTLIGDTVSIDLQQYIDAVDNLLDTQTQQILTGVLAFNNSLVNTLDNNGGTDLSVIQDQISTLGSDILSLFESNQYFIDNRINDVLSQIESSAFTTRSNISGLILSSEGILLDSMAQTQQSLSSLISQDLNQTIGYIDTVENRINQDFTQQTQTIVNEIRSLGTIDNTSGGNTSYQSAWTDAYIVDLLNVLETFRTDFVNKEFTVDVTIDNSGAGDGSTPDQSAGGILSGNILVDELVNGLLNGLMGIDASGASTDSHNTYNNIIDIITHPDQNNINTYDDLQNALNNLGFSGSLLNLLWNVTSGLFLFLRMGNSVAEPFLNNLQTIARTDALDGLLSANTLLELFIRDEIEQESFFKQFKQIGFNDGQILDLLRASTVQLPEPFVRAGFLRGELNDEQWREKMRQLGYRQGDLDLIQKLNENVPPIQDAILFAVREAYDETLASELQLDSNYDTIKDKFEQNLKSNGIAPEYAKYYWRSHWRLPAPTQFYDMFHRGLITEDEMLNALRVSDYSPQWQQKLVDINYSPLTRVDIRRIHKLLNKDREWLIEQYKIGGYNQLNAETMADFTIQYNQSSETGGAKEFTMSQVINLFTTGLLSEDEAKQDLTDIGYAPFEIDKLIQYAVINKNSETLGDISKDNKRRIINRLSQSYVEGILPESYVRNELANIGYTSDNVDTEIQYLNIERSVLQKENEVDIIFNQYSRYQISINEASAVLNGLGYSGTELTTIMKLWKIVRDDRKKLPTKTEAKSFLEENKITRGEYDDILRGIGIMEKYISMY